MSQPLLPSDDLVARAFADALGLYVGRGRRFATEAVADSTDTPASTLRAYREGRIVPGLGAALRLAAVLPPAFADQVLSVAGLGVVARDAVPPAAPALAADLAAMMAALTEALRDGRIDHVERARMRPMARALHALLASWAEGEGT